MLIFDTHRPITIGQKYNVLPMTTNHIMAVNY